MNKTLNCIGRFWLVVLAGMTGVAAADDRPVVFVSILPQVDFVERVAGGRVRVEALVQPGDNPALYEPTPRQMAALAKAKLYFRIGVPVENSVLPKIKSSMKGLRIVDTREGITLRRMEGCGHEGHAHDSDGADPHIWTSPQLVKVQVATIARALGEFDPAGAAVYQKNLLAFQAELDALDQRLAKALAPIRGRTLMVFHPAWGYFADAYGLKQVAIEVEGKSPPARQLARIIDTARREQVKVIFVQPQFSRGGAEAVAKAIGGAVVALDPLARDYLRNLEQVAEKVGKALAGKGDEP